MTRLIHLNGPPGIGKSTLAAMYADRHPGTLNLDVDTLHHLIGGWRDSEARFHEHLRPLAHAMAAAHLARGNDVVLPQYIGEAEQLAGFESIARQCGADFFEVILLADRAAAIARFNARPRDTEWHRHNQALVADLGGDAFLGVLYDRLLSLLDSRPDAYLVDSRPGAIADTLVVIESTLGR